MTFKTVFNTEVETYFEMEMCNLYGASSLEMAENIASGYMLVSDDSQPVDDETLSKHIDEMRKLLNIA